MNNEIDLIFQNIEIYQVLGSKNEGKEHIIDHL